MSAYHFRDIDLAAMDSAARHARDYGMVDALDAEAEAEIRRQYHAIKGQFPVPAARHMTSEAAERISALWISSNLQPLAFFRVVDDAA